MLVSRSNAALARPAWMPGTPRRLLALLLAPPLPQLQLLRHDPAGPALAVLDDRRGAHEQPLARPRLPGGRCRLVAACCATLLCNFAIKYAPLIQGAVSPGGQAPPAAAFKQSAAWQGPRRPRAAPCAQPSPTPHTPHPHPPPLEPPLADGLDAVELRSHQLLQHLVHCRVELLALRRHRRRVHPRAGAWRGNPGRWCLVLPACQPAGQQRVATHWKGQRLGLRAGSQPGLGNARRCPCCPDDTGVPPALPALCRPSLMRPGTCRGLWGSASRWGRSSLPFEAPTRTRFTTGCRWGGKQGENRPARPCQASSARQRALWGGRV